MALCGDGGALPGDGRIAKSWSLASANALSAAKAKCSYTNDLGDPEGYIFELFYFK